jgi:hypothetical protein
MLWKSTQNKQFNYGCFFSASKWCLTSCDTMLILRNTDFLKKEAKKASHRSNLLFSYTLNQIKTEDLIAAFFD